MGHTTATFSGAHRLYVLGRLTRIKEGHVSLGADRIHRPVQSICQAHVLLAVRKLCGELLRTKNRRDKIYRNKCRRGLCCRRKNSLPYTGCPPPSIDENSHLEKQHPAPERKMVNT